MSYTEITFSLLTLSLLEIVLGVDNLIFISIASGRLPHEQQKAARRFGLILALLTRLLLLASVTWLTRLTTPLLTLFAQSFSVRDLLLLGGGLFLIYKGTVQIHAEIEHATTEGISRGHAAMWSVILQIGIFDIIFSFDSVFTAVGMTPHFWIMATAICIAILVMIFAAEPLSAFVERNPTIKMLALSFLLLVGTMLVADGFQYHIPRAYVYFAISYAVFVELLNAAYKRRRRLRAQA